MLKVKFVVLSKTILTIIAIYFRFNPWQVFPFLSVCVRLFMVTILIIKSE